MTVNVKCQENPKIVGFYLTPPSSNKITSSNFRSRIMHICLTTANSYAGLRTILEHANNRSFLSIIIKAKINYIILSLVNKETHLSVGEETVVAFHVRIKLFHIKRCNIFKKRPFKFFLLFLVPFITVLHQFWNNITFRFQLS